MNDEHDMGNVANVDDSIGTIVTADGEIECYVTKGALTKLPIALGLHVRQPGA